MPNTSKAVIALAALVATGACLASTRLTAVWKSPEVTTVRFNKVLVAAQSPDESRRRAIEDFLVARIANASPSYKILTSEEARDVEKARVKIVAGGFDGAVVVRFVGTTQQTTYVPGTAYWGPAPYGSMWGYWGYGWGSVYDPGYLQTDTVVALESNVYSLAKEQLVWSSRSETISPGSIQDLMQSVVEVTVREMKKRNVL